jgi:hypothetical protein
MGLASFSSFEGPDFFAFVVCGVTGYFLGTFAPAGAPSIYASILISYHLFLAWLVFGKSTGHEDGAKKAGVSLPLVHTVLTHAACLIVVLAPVSLALHRMPSIAAPRAAAMEAADADDPMASIKKMNRMENAIRLVKGISCSIAGLAVFERKWLFSSEATEKPRPQPVAPSVPAVRATSDDAADWHAYLAANRQSFSPGASVKAEYEKWLVARRGSQPPAPPGPAVS